MPSNGGCRPECPAGSWLFRFRGERLGLSHPGIGAGRKADFFADLVGGVMIELGELPVVEDAKIVELLLDGARHASQLLEVVRSATRTGQALETSRRCGGWRFFACRMGR